MRRVLLSVKPEFVSKIFSSDKTVELRKRIPQLIEGDELLIYASAPVMAIVGAVEVTKVVQQAPEDLWRMVRAHAAVERDFFAEYYQDHAHAYGIFLGCTRLYESACPLLKLRKSWPGFVAPQNYRYVQVWNGIDSERTLMSAQGIRPTTRAGEFGLHLK